MVHACFSTDSNFMPPFLLYPGEQLHNIKFDEFPSVVFEINKLAWMDQVIFCKWIQHFHQHLDKEKIEQPVILFINGYWSHISFFLSRFCQENKIILYILHPNATHVTQPIDIRFFGPLKHAWK